MQVYSYLYELVKNNYDASNLSKVDRVIELKQNIISGTGNINYDQIINLIRQGLAHNDDEIEHPNLTISIQGNYTFKSRDFPDNTITMNPVELLELTGFYIKNITAQYKENFTISSSLSKITRNKRINKGSQIIKLYDENLNQEICADSNQERVLLSLINDYKQGVDIDAEKISLYYPFKANYQNLARQQLAMATFLTVIYQNRAQCLDYVLEKMINEKNALLSFAGLEADKDFLVSILVSQIYDLLTCVTPQKLQTVLDELNIEIKANKFRNAIMHGTFFYDKEDFICLYDARSKKEQDLKHVGNISIDQMLKLLTEAQIKRYNSFQEQSDETLENDKIL